MLCNNKLCFKPLSLARECLDEPLRLPLRHSGIPFCYELDALFSYAKETRLLDRAVTTIDNQVIHFGINGIPAPGGARDISIAEDQSTPWMRVINDPYRIVAVEGFRQEVLVLRIEDECGLGVTVDRPWIDSPHLILSINARPDNPAGQDHAAAFTRILAEGMFEYDRERPLRDLD